MDEANKVTLVNQVPEAVQDSEIQPALAKSGETSGKGRKRRKKKKSWKQELREWVVSIAVALVVVLVIRTFFFQIVRVDGDSMNSTLLHNERLFTTVLDVKLSGVDRGDVVICHYPDRGSTNFVKRIVAVPGDSIYRENGYTHVVYEVTDDDGNVSTVDEVLDGDKFTYYQYSEVPSDYGPYVLGEDEYFAVGDNRYNSHDSRNWNDAYAENDVGPITGGMIVGRVRAVIWPLSEIRTVE